MIFSATIIELLILNWVIATTIGLLSDKPRIEKLKRLFQHNYMPLTFIYYAMTGILAIFTVFVGFILGSIMGIFIVEPIGEYTLPQIENFALFGAVLTEFLVLFFVGRYWGNKLFPPPL